MLLRMVGRNSQSRDHRIAFVGHCLAIDNGNAMSCWRWRHSTVHNWHIMTGMNLRLFLVIKLMTIGVIWESLEIVKVVVISFIRIEKGKRELQGYEAFCFD